MVTTDAKQQTSRSLNSAEEQTERDDTKPSSHFSEGEIVTVLVGPEKQAFHVHKRLLREKVPYFRTSLKRAWQSDVMKPVEVKAIDVTGFRILMQWLYNEDLPTCEDKGLLTWDMMDIAYQTGDRLMAIDFQNKLIDLHLEGLRQDTRFWYPGKLEILENLDLDHTPLYQLVLKSVVNMLYEASCSSKNLSRNVDGLTGSKNLLKEILLAIHAFGKEPWPEVYDMPPCEFHIQEDGKTCEQRKRRAKRTGK